MAEYLYGAAVQGIQGFIFQTNTLSEIVGASELVEEICTTKFAQILYNDAQLQYKNAKDKLKDDPNVILFAAGNIKCKFTDKAECERVVARFPMEVSQFAPGITLSQAVVEMSGSYAEFKDAVNELESRLRTQRNRPMSSQNIGLMGILRSRKTGLPVVAKRDDEGKPEFDDAATWAKLYEYDAKEKKVRKRTTKELCKKAFKEDNIKDNQIAYNIGDITKDNDWVAVIHADGNGLGQIVQKIGQNEEKFKEFSVNLDLATTEAAQEAYKAVEPNFRNDKKIPIRPIVLGGDDLTVICRADLALEYTETFIRKFEEKTRKYLGKIILENDVFTKGDPNDCLTACAGIAYIKSSYPFYYGYALAETLCSVAKKDAKDKKEIREGNELPQSCLMFHKVQSSFVEEYSEIVRKELTPQDNISLQFGPYYINDNIDKTYRWTVEKLKTYASKLDSKEGNAVKSHLRNWLTLLHENEAMAKQKLDRLKKMTQMNQYVNDVTKGDTVGGKNLYPVYDILAIHTINTQKTK